MAKCDQCDGTGWLLVAVDSSQKNFTGRLAIKRYRHCPSCLERNLALSVPERYRGAELATLETSARGVAEAWLVHPGNGLFLTGPVGSGKTHAACAIVKAWRRRHPASAASFEPLRDLYGTLRSAVATGSPPYDSYLAPLRSEALVALDDLGSGSASDFERRVLLEILDARWNAKLPTIATSNFSLDQIAELMDARIASRLAAFTLVELDGPDRRLAL